MVTNDLDGKPFQLKFVRAAQMMMFANVVCDPPIGQDTVIPFGQDAVNFTVLIESSISFPEQGWEVVLWHNGHANAKWDELPLHEVNLQLDEAPLAIASQGRPKAYRRYFCGSISRANDKAASIAFTLKFKTSLSPSWKWANEHSCQTDGGLYFQAKEVSMSIEQYIDNLSPSFDVTAVHSEVVETQLWSLTLPLAAAGSKSVFSLDTLGLPHDFVRWFALVRLWTPWLAPRHGRNKFETHEDAILCSFLRRDGLHLVLLAVSGVEDVVTVFKHDGAGNVVVSSRNDGSSPARSRVIVAVGRTFETANAACMYQARKTISQFANMSEAYREAVEAPVDEKARAQYMENWYDGLTYCTWNGLGQDLTEKKIYHALDTLEKNNIKITNLIIDDNWQSLDNSGKGQFERGWTSFEANKEGFPHGLLYTITTIRDNHPSIQHVAVWHALFGYWGGISPTGDIAKKYKTKVVPRSNGNAKFMKPQMITVVDAEDVQRMYNDFYQFLLSSRIDSVKTDAQFFLDLLENAEDRRRLTRSYQDAWTISSLRYFSVKAISCMSQTPQILFHSQLPTNRPQQMVRNCDDFFPEIPTSHPWHIYMNAYNSLFTSHLNVLPDWDMFQTYHEYSSYHAAGRCVSGGPIYFTDEPGKHDVSLIHQMTALDIKKRTITLRPSCVGKTIASGVYNAYEDLRLLKVGTYHGKKETGTGILGIFNVSQQPLAELVMLHEFLGVESGLEYVVRAHTTGEISPPMRSDSKLPFVSLEVQPKSWEILTTYPLHAFNIKYGDEAKPRETKFAILGLLGRMTGAAVIENSEYKVGETGRLNISVALKALGVLGIYISELQALSIKNQMIIMIGRKVISPHTVSKSLSVANLLEIDIETAWNELQVPGGYSNELDLEIFIS